MTKAKAKRYAHELTFLAHLRSAMLANNLTQLHYGEESLRDERDFLLTLAADLRLLSEGRRLPQKRKAVR